LPSRLASAEGAVFVEAAAVAEAAAPRGDVGIGMTGPAGYEFEPLARGTVESKKASAAAAPAIHKAGEKIAANVDGPPSLHVRF
jgi:hypothetical protein